MDPLASLTHESFADRIGETFSVRSADTSVELVLAEAVEGSSDGGRGPDGQVRRQFSIVFRGAAQTPLAQGTYAFAHADFGALALFIVPIGSDAEGIRYEAAFG